MLRGAAIECRINAEDFAADFRPSAGKIEQMIVPGGMGVRFDSHAHAGYAVPPHYDSLIGKLIVHQPTRDAAIAVLRRALDELRIEGIQTTIPFHRQMMRDTVFQRGAVDTKYVERRRSS